MKKSELEDVLLNTENLFMVDVRFYCADKGIEQEDDDYIPKAIVTKVGNEYYNAIIGEKYPMITSYGKADDNYIEFSGIENQELMDEEGICYVKIENELMSEIKKDQQISIRELEEKMLYSDIYFKDRIYIIDSRISFSRKNNLRLKHKLSVLANKDREKNEYFQQKLQNKKWVKKLN